jgi:hypothetical protein
MIERDRYFGARVCKGEYARFKIDCKRSHLMPSYLCAGDGVAKAHCFCPATLFNAEFAAIVLNRQIGTGSG